MVLEGVDTKREIGCARADVKQVSVLQVLEQAAEHEEERHRGELGAAGRVRPRIEEGGHGRRHPEREAKVRDAAVARRNVRAELVPHALAYDVRARSASATDLRIVTSAS